MNVKCVRRGFGVCALQRACGGVIELVHPAASNHKHTSSTNVSLSPLEVQSFLRCFLREPFWNSARDHALDKARARARARVSEPDSTIKFWLSEEAGIVLDRVQLCDTSMSYLPFPGDEVLSDSFDCDCCSSVICCYVWERGTEVLFVFLHHSAVAYSS